MVPLAPGCCVSSRKRAPPGIPGPISVSRAGGLGPGLGYIVLPPTPGDPNGLRRCKAGPTRLALSSCPTLTLPMHLQVKQLRLEREREKAMREQELEMLQREKEAEHFKTWEEQEDNFHLQQAKLRCVGKSGAWGLPTTMLHPLSLATSFWTQTHGAHVCPRAFALPVHPAWNPFPWLFPSPFEFLPVASSGSPPRPSLWYWPLLCVHTCHWCVLLSPLWGWVWRDT